MIGAAQRYIQLATELLLLRELSGGPLSDELESAYIDQFDRCWQAMTREEQDDAEWLIAQTAINAPNDLGEADVVVTLGKKERPRSKALAA
jgi:hypothetical protein